MTHLSEADLEDHVTNKLNLEIVTDEDGVKGVEIVDSNAGTYRFKRARLLRVSKGGHEVYEDKGVAEERYADLAAKQALRVGGGRAEIPGLLASDDGVKLLHVGRFCPAALEGPEVARARSVADDESSSDVADSSTADGHDASAVGSVVQSSQTPPLSAPVLRQSAAVPAESSRGRSSAPERKRPHSVVASSSPDGGDGSTCGRQKKRRRGNAEFVKETAQQLLDSTESSMDFSGHWQSATRRRDFDALVSRLEANGRKTGALFGDDDAMNLSQKLFTLAETLQNRQALFECIRDDFAVFALKPLDQLPAKMITEAPRELLGSMLTLHLHGLIDKAVGSQERIKAFLSALRFVPAKLEQPGVPTLSLLGDGGAAFAEASQKTLACAFCEKMLRNPDANLIAEVAGVLQKVLPQTSFADIVVKDSGHANPSGWFGQPLADLHCAMICGLALPHVLRDEGIPRAYRAPVFELVAGKNKASGSKGVSARKSTPGPLKKGVKMKIFGPVFRGSLKGVLEKGPGILEKGPGVL